MKKTLLTWALGLVATLTFAQQQISIHDLQFRSQADLGNCLEESTYNGDTVIIVGMAIHDGNLTEVYSSSTTGNSRPGLWIVDTADNASMGDFKGIEVHGVAPDGTAVTYLNSITAGTIVKIIGEVDEYSGETEIYPLNNSVGTIAAGDAIEIISLGNPAPSSTHVDVSLLNNTTAQNQLTTGEEWEGSYIEITDVSVVDVSEFNSGGNRVSFTVADVNGNQIQISDKFLAQHLPSWSTVNGSSPESYGAFSIPAYGAQFDTIRGIVTHSINGCSGDGYGYQLNPFDTNDYVYGPTPPNITDVTRYPLIPTSAESPEVKATIIDNDGTIVSAELFYATNGGSYTTIAMSVVSGGTDVFAVNIPAFADGTEVSYYIEATDDAGNTTIYPTATTQKHYIVRDNGATIVDVQKVNDPATYDRSSYEGDTVTVTGIVTASTKSNDLGYVYIQQEGATEWAGISLVGNSDLLSLYRGQEVVVTGIVEENYYFTRLSVIELDTTGNYGVIEPVIFEPSNDTLHANNSMERYESMLVTIANSDGTPMYVTEPDLGYAEYGIGTTDTSSVHQVVLAGRQNSTSFSSLYFSLISDDYYVDNDGEIEVDSIVLTHQGQMIDSLTGLMHYSYSVYKLIPRNNSDIVGLADSLGTPYVIDSTIVPTPDTSVGIVTLAGKEMKLTIYPNPANDVINIAVENNDAALNVEVLDLAGRSMVKTRLNQQQLAISTESIVNGVYLVKLSDSEGNILSIEKLVVNK